jgi:hypothetical protein
LKISYSSRQTPPMACGYLNNPEYTHFHRQPRKYTHQRLNSSI